MATPDWLQQYADTQGWNPPEQPNPKDVADLQAYADSFGPKQPNPSDVADLQSYADSFGKGGAMDTARAPVIQNTDAPPPGQEGSGGHWEVEDDGSRNWYVPPGAPSDPEGGPLAQTFTEKNKAGTKKPNVELAFKIPGTDVDTDALKQGARALWGATLPTSVSNPGPAIQGLGAAKKAGLVQGLASGDPGKTLDAINAGASASAQTPNEFGTKGFQNLGPENPQDIDPATGQPRKTAREEDDREPVAPQGHWVNGQWIRTVSPEALGMEGKLERNRGEHAADEADAARALSLQREQIYNQRTAELQAQADAARAEQARTTAARDKAEKDYDHAQQLSDAAKVDPDRFWENKSTGAHVMAVLGVALGAVGSSMTHTPNDALEMIKSAIDHDLEAQKVNAANAQKGTENAWQKLRAATGSAQQADNLYRVAALQTAQGQLDELNAGPQQRAGVDAALQQAKDQQQARALQFRLQTEKYSPGYMTGGGAATGGAPADDEKSLTLPHAVGGYQANTRLIFKNKEEAGEARERLTALGIVRRARDRIAQLEKENPLDIYRPGSQAHDDAEQIRLNAVTQVGHLGGVKKLPIFDAEKMNDALKPSMYNAAIGSSATHRLDTYLQNANDSVEESLNTTSPEIGKRHLNVNQRGEVTPGVHYTGEDIERKPMPKGFKAVGGTQGGAGLKEAPPLQYKPEIRHVTETPGKGKKKATSTVTSTEAEEDEDER